MRDVRVSIEGGAGHQPGRRVAPALTLPRLADARLQDAFNAPGVVRRDRGPDVAAGVEHQRDVLVRSFGIEVPPLQEVAAAPEPPPPHLARARQRKFLDALDRRIGNSLCSPWVVPAPVLLPGSDI